MNSDEYLRLMLRTMRQDATYSPQRHAWVIAALRARIFVLERLDDLPVDFTSAEEVLMEGARKGLWEMNPATDVLLLK